MVDVLITGVIVAAAIVLAEVAARRWRLSEFAARKTLHLAAALAVAAGTVVADYRAYLWTGLIFTAVMVGSRWLPLATLAAMRQTSLGEVFFPVGVALSSLIAPNLTGFVAASLVLGLADTAAALAGRHWASPRLLWSKTLAGSGAFLLVAGVLLLVIAPRPPVLAIVAASTLAEALSPKGSDNLTVPVVVALGFALLG